MNLSQCGNFRCRSDVLGQLRHQLDVGVAALHPREADIRLRCNI